MPNTTKKVQGIKAWAEDDRPREKLRLKGREALSDAELVAILIGSGSRKETAVQLAKRILASVNANLIELGTLEIDSLCTFKGIGEAKAISIITALELGRRRRLSESMVRKKIDGSTAAFEILQPFIAELAHEEFWVLYLNASNRLLRAKRISIGGLNSTTADPRIIFKEAMLTNATALILAHNHPSGGLKPSNADKAITKKLISAGQSLDILVCDHLILHHNQYFSFSDEGLM
jgi:DNA repair protein RadC